MTRTTLLSKSAALLLAAGIAGGGWFVGQGISKRDQGARTISVKGLSEREVPASIASWNLGYTATGNDIREIKDKLAAATQSVTAYLKAAGFDAAEVALQPPSVHDHSMDERDKDTQPPPYRFSARQSVSLRTTKVDQVKPAVAGTSQLMESGVLLAATDAPSYLFDRVNEIKPGMIEEATKNARLAGEQFARDSNIALGRLVNAYQGSFQIDDRDAATPERKIVRVVVSVSFEIE